LSGASSTTVTGKGTAGTADAGVITVQGINSAYPLNVSALSQTGIVVNYNTVSSIADGSTGTVSYTVTAAKTFYLKGIIASSSGAPCKVIIDYGAGLNSSCSRILCSNFAVFGNEFCSAACNFCWHSGKC
jgi:hypothetical protein